MLSVVLFYVFGTQRTLYKLFKKTNQSEVMMSGIFQLASVSISRRETPSLGKHYSKIWLRSSLFSDSTSLLFFGNLTILSLQGLIRTISELGVKNVATVSVFTTCLVHMFVVVNINYILLAIWGKVCLVAFTYGWLSFRISDLWMLTKIVSARILLLQNSFTKL